MCEWNRKPMRGRAAISALLLFALTLLTAPASAEARLEALEIVTATGPHILRVEVARTSKEREKGLMFRASLPEDAGMLFDFQKAQTILMWMKNTPLPLDMIFVSPDGRIVSVAQGEPFSERVISSGAPASAVIEVNAGTARRLSVAVGDVVRHSIFGK